MCVSVKANHKRKKYVSWKRLKITVSKHSVACTDVEQAADTGPMFKELKRISNNTANPHSANSLVYCFLAQDISSLETKNLLTPNTSPSKILNLPIHKKKVILVTASKLTIAWCQAYSDLHIKKSFILNGQLDISHKLVLCLSGLLNTYRGNIEGIYMKTKETLVDAMYEEAFTTCMMK